MTEKNVAADIAALEVEVRYMRQTLDRVATALDKLAVVETRLQRLDTMESELAAIRAELADLKAWRYKMAGALAVVPAAWAILAKKLGF